MKEAHRDQSGAVLVEFLVAAMPLLISFFSFVQLAQIVTARLVVKHAAIVGARGAAVISNKNGTTPDQKPNGNEADIKKAVEFAMGPWNKTMRRVDVTVDDKSSCDDPYGLVTVTVDVDYRCSVPFGNFLVCGKNGNIHHIRQTFGFPHEGARYSEGGGSSCGSN